MYLVPLTEVASEIQQRNTRRSPAALRPPSSHPILNTRMSRMTFPLGNPHSHQPTGLTTFSAQQTRTTTAATTILINSNNNNNSNWSHHHAYQSNNDGFSGYCNSQRTIGTNLGPTLPIDPTGPFLRSPDLRTLPPPNPSPAIQVLPVQCVPLPDCSKPPPILFQYPPHASFYPSPGQESDSFFSEASSMASSKHREEGPSHWDQGSDSAKGSTSHPEDQDSYWRASYPTGAPPWYPHGPNTLSTPFFLNPELISTTPCQGAQAETDDWGDQNSVFDWDQYILIEEKKEEKYGGEMAQGDVEKESRDAVDMEICSMAPEGNDEEDRESERPTHEAKSFFESERLTDSQMLSLLRHLSATDKKNNTNKNICHTIELFLTLLPVQLPSDAVDQHKSSMSSSQRQIFELLQSKAPWVVDEQIIRSMDLLPFILKSILTSMDLHQSNSHTLPHSTRPAPQTPGPSEGYSKRQQPHQRRRKGQSPRRSRSSSVNRRERERSRSPVRHLAPRRDSPPPPRRRLDSSLHFKAVVPQSPPKLRGFQCQGRGRNIFKRSPEPRTNPDRPRVNARHAERKPGRGHGAKATVRLHHLSGDEEEQSTEARTVTEDSEANPKPPVDRIECKCRKNRLETIRQRIRQPPPFGQTSSVLRWQKRTNLTRKRLAKSRAPSLMTLSLPPLSRIRQTVLKTPFVQPTSLLTAKVPLLATAPPPTRITSTPLIRKTPLSAAPLAISHRGLLPDPGSKEHFRIIEIKTISRLGLQPKFR